MAVKLIALDMDGTLLNSEHHVSRFSRETIAQAGKRGVLLAFATGRSLCELGELRRELTGMRYAIVENGASVRDLATGETLYAADMSMDDVRRIYARVAPFHPMFEVLADDCIRVQRSFLEHIDAYDTCGFASFMLETRTPIPDMERYLSERTAPVSKLHMFFRDHPTRERALEAVKDLPYDITHQLYTNLEFNRLGVTKGEGVAILAKHLGIPLSDVMAVGDNLNDVPMLKAVGVSVAMGNSEPEALAAAKYRTLTNDEDGAARAILQWAV